MYVYMYTVNAGDPNVKSSVSSGEITPLHVAAQHGHLACLQLLVHTGGDIMRQDRRHMTPVDYAQVHGQGLCFNFLIEIIGEWPGEGWWAVDELVQWTPA